MLILIKFPLFGVIWGLWGPDAGITANPNTFSMVLEARIHSEFNNLDNFTKFSKFW